MEREAEPVFVFADDGLNVFADLDALLGWIEAPDVEEGVRPRSPQLAASGELGACSASEVVPQAEPWVLAVIATAT